MKKVGLLMTMFLVLLQVSALAVPKKTVTLNLKDVSMETFLVEVKNATNRRDQESQHANPGSADMEVEHFLNEAHIYFDGGIEKHHGERRQNQQKGNHAQDF